MEGNIIQWDIYKQRGANAESSFETTPEQCITMTATNQWVYIPVEVTDRENWLTARHHSYQLPEEPTPPHHSRNILPNNAQNSSDYYKD